MVLLSPRTNDIVYNDFDYYSSSALLDKEPIGSHISDLLQPIFLSNFENFNENSQC